MDRLVADRTEGAAFVSARLVARLALRLGRGLSGRYILFGGAVRLALYITETTDLVGGASSENFARCLGAASLVCMALCTLPPASLVGAILAAGYLGSAFVSHVGIGGPPFAHLLFGTCPGVVVWGVSRLYERYLPTLPPFAD